MKVGVFLARMQPVHKGHLAMISKMIEEGCEKILILLGSADKLDSRNPIPIALRVEMLKEALQELFTDNIKFKYAEDRIIIVKLSDLTSETDNSHDWGFYLYNAIVKEIDQHYFVLYYSDGFELVAKWFPPFLFTNSIDLRLVARNNCEKGISATRVRDLIINDSKDLKDVVPTAVLNRKEILKIYIESFK